MRSMATISITTDYKFSKKSTQKLLDAMDRSDDKGKVNKTQVEATKVKNEKEINSILEGF